MATDSQVIYSKRFECVYEADETIECIDFTAIYGDCIFNGLYHELDREPKQYEYDCAIHDEFNYYIQCLIKLEETK